MRVHGGAVWGCRPLKEGQAWGSVERPGAQAEAEIPVTLGALRPAEHVSLEFWM